jgi:hypothetical protein
MVVKASAIVVFLIETISEAGAGVGSTCRKDNNYYSG